MAVERFLKTNLKISLEGNTFPPESFVYEGKKLVLAGTSNKMDLLPSIEDEDVLSSITNGIGVNQFIYTDSLGSLYDACIYSDGPGNIVLYGICSRRRPDKPRKPKKGEEDELQVCLGDT